MTEIVPVGPKDLAAPRGAPAPVEARQVSMEILTEEQMAEASRRAEAIDLSDTSSIPIFGRESHRDLGEVSTQMLEGLKPEEFGTVGGTVRDMMLRVKELDVDSLRKKPLLRRWASQIQLFFERHKQMEPIIQDIENRMVEHEVMLTRNNQNLDRLDRERETALVEMTVDIAAGSMALEKLRQMQTELEQEYDRERKLEISEKLNALRAFVARFERRVHALQGARIQAIQSGPAIQMIQDANLGMMERIVLVRDTVLPNWRRQLAMAATLYMLKGATELQRVITETNTQIIQKTAQMIRQGTVDATTELEREAFDTNALLAANQVLIQALQEAARIAEQAHVMRERAMQTREQLLVALSDALAQADQLTPKPPAEHQSSQKD